MKYSKFFKFLEKKDHLINKLTTLTPEQKQEVITFFAKHPNYENEIDWNRKDLIYEDFEEVMMKERVSASQLKKFIKEGRHYLVLYKSKDLVVYQPLTWLGSRYIASDVVAPYIEGKWCTSYQKSIDYWNSYSFNQRRSFLYLCTPTTKWALEIQPDRYWYAWNALDRNVSLEDFFTDISKEVLNIREILEKLIPQAVKNYDLVVKNREIDEEDTKILEELRRQAREAHIKYFSKAFKKQVNKKGYYQWDGDLNLEDLNKLGLYDEETGFFDERVSKFKVIGSVDFKNCTSENIYLPQYIEKSFTLEKNENLKSIVIPDSVTSIGDYAFAGCISLKEITIPDSVTEIGERAFSICLSLTSIIIPDSVTYIGDYAFRSCSSLTEVLISDSVTSISDGAFWGCTKLTSVTIPDSVTSIGNSAFYRCYRLADIVIPDSVTFIGDEALSYSKSLKAAYIDKEKGSLDISNTGIPSRTKIYWKGEF